MTAMPIEEEVSALRGRGGRRRRVWRPHLAVLGPMTAADHRITDDPAQIFRLPRFRGELGFITPMSSHHCQTCNRLRPTAAGALRPCLFGETELDVKNPLRHGASEALLASVFARAMSQKTGRLTNPPGDFPRHAASMVSIGG